MSDSGFRYPAMRGVFTGDRVRSAELPRPVEKSVEIDLLVSLDAQHYRQVAYRQVAGVG
jgi:hypothetical protein